jgi:hypothetical protein
MTSTWMYAITVNVIALLALSTSKDKGFKLGMFSVWSAVVVTVIAGHFIG